MNFCQSVASLYNFISTHADSFGQFILTFNKKKTDTNSYI